MKCVWVCHVRVCCACVLCVCCACVLSIIPCACVCVDREGGVTAVVLVGDLIEACTLSGDGSSIEIIIGNPTNASTVASGDAAEDARTECIKG